MKKITATLLFFILLVSNGFAQSDKDVAGDSAVIDVPYTLDLSASTFRLNSYSKLPMFFYTVYGQGNPFDFPFPNHFSIIDKSATVGNIKDYIETIVKMCKTGLKVLNSLKEKEIEINGYKAYEISFTGRIDNTFFKTYMVVLTDGKTTLLFTGRAVNNYDVMIKEFKAIVRTIKIK